MEGIAMKGIIMASLMVVGILVFAGTAIGVTYAKYDEATTQVTVGDGLRCTINGKAVSDGETVTTKLDGGYLKVHVESDTPVLIGCSGVWYSDKNTATEHEETDKEVTSHDFKIPFRHGKYNGKLMISDTASADYCCPIQLVLHFDESKIMIWFSFANDFRHDGDTVTVLGYDVFGIKHVDGQSHTFSWNGSWGNDKGDYGSISGTDTGTEVSVNINNFRNMNAVSTGDVTFTLVE